MYCKLILLFVFFCIKNGDALPSAKMLVTFFASHSEKGVMPLNVFKTFVQQNYDMTQDCEDTVGKIESKFKNGIKKGTFIWAINSVDNSIQLQDALSPAELLEEYFDRENKNGILSYDAYLSYVQQNYKTAEYYDKLVTNISKRLKYGINQEIFTWTISNVDKRIPCPKGFTPLDTAGSSQHAELLEKSKRMDNEFDGEYFDRTK